MTAARDLMRELEAYVHLSICEYRLREEGQPGAAKLAATQSKKHLDEMQRILEMIP